MIRFGQHLARDMQTFCKESLKNKKKIHSKPSRQEHIADFVKNVEFFWETSQKFLENSWSVSKKSQYNCKSFKAL